MQEKFQSFVSITVVTAVVAFFIVTIIVLIFFFVDSVISKTEPEQPTIEFEEGAYHIPDAVIRFKEREMGGLIQPYHLEINKSHFTCTETEEYFECVLKDN